METEPHRDRDDVADSRIDRARRRQGGVAVRTSFLQRGPQARPLPGPLHQLVHNHDERGLDLYLLDARIWARGLGLPTPRDDGAAAVSKTWRRLEDHGLIARERQGRLANITLLHESGNGRPYTYPSGRGRGRYFKLSEQFWTAPDRWYRTLSLRAKAMLLIASSLKPGFVLPLEQAPKWYGVSPDVAGDGLGELEDKGLLSVFKQHRREPLSPAGYVVENSYTLLGPFAQDWRTTPALATVTDIRDAAAGGG
ncbi:MAG: hypothetical protein L0H26_10360 [Microlunatus sp.]|nr:hypothetical protein [Microlunatus sp.]